MWHLWTVQFKIGERKSNVFAEKSSFSSVIVLVKTKRKIDKLF